MAYVDPSGAGTPTTGQPISSTWGRDVQTDVEVEEAALLLVPPLVVNETKALHVLVAPTTTVGTWALNAAGTQMSNTSAALNDSATWTTSLVPGTYDVRAIGTTASNQGQIQFALDGVNIGSVFDQYSAATFLLTAVTVATLGAHTFKATITGKNASSSGYLTILTNVLLTRRS